ncbi:MAG: hypothetical protein WBO55_05895 [Rhizobiaceae bacterium]
MKNFVKGLGVAALLAAGSAGFAQAGDMKMMMDGAAACNSSYAQCVSASDMTMASTPSEGMNKMKMNMMHGQECGAALRACYGSLK